ncbi:2'-5' RNA ligase family protein [Nocardia tengchongensis]|uniref:2'-5' RNA ligase family protein n=1 Tax=Nocardia tengchongensis TaxID=2055889 RepID=UPI0036A7E76F
MPDRQDSKPMIEVARSGSFPELPPTSLTDIASIRENDWAAFCDVEQMVNHWGRNAWPAGREVYFWYLTFEDQNLVNLVAGCHAGVGPDGIDFVPLDALHMTILRIGDCSEITEGDIHAIADEAKQRLSEVRSFNLSVGPLAGSRGAIRFTVSPWNELFKVHQIVRESTRKVLPALAIASTTGFRPHIGVGYSNQKQDAEPFIKQVSSLRHIAPVTVRVDTVKIVRLRREPHTYRWSDVAEITLVAS